MTAQDIARLCLDKPDAYEDRPFGEYPICFRLGGKIFAQLYPDKVTLKCTRSMGEFLRQLYPDQVTRGYHCPPVQQPYWNTVLAYETFPSPELRSMIDHAYDTVKQSLGKKKRR